MDQNNNGNKSGSSKIIKNLATFKNPENYVKCKKLIKNLIKFKISKELSFLNSITRLVYIRLR